MRIMVNFEADSAERLREQMLLFLGLQTAGEGAYRSVEQIDSKLKPKKAKASPQAPEPPPSEPTSSDEAATEAIERALEDLAEEDDVTPEAQKAVDLMKLKEAQLSRLRDLFNAGKGPLVRQLLAKYGNGAKVFPEVDAARFPDIKVELDRELGAN